MTKANDNDRTAYEAIDKQIATLRAARKRITDRMTARTDRQYTQLLTVNEIINALALAGSDDPLRTTDGRTVQGLGVCRMRTNDLSIEAHREGWRGPWTAGELLEQLRSSVDVTNGMRAMESYKGYELTPDGDTKVWFDAHYEPGFGIVGVKLLKTFVQLVLAEVD